MAKTSTRSASEIVQLIGAFIAIITALMSVWGWLGEKLPWLREQSDNPAFVWLFWVGIAALLAVGLSLLWRGLSRKSRLLRPEALRLDPDNPDHLRGREEDIQRLSGAVTTLPLVFLEGESGAGKSALIRSGLLPAIKNADSPSLLPVYLNTYSGDWESGVVEPLVFAFWRELGETRRVRLGITKLDELRSELPWIEPSVGCEGALFHRIGNELGLIPLLIFDQFDDYQLAHNDRFSRQGRWISADELATENGFWRAIRAELERGAIHCLFITRRDMSGRLEAVRFLAPQLHFLDRVQPAYMGALLAELVTPGGEGTPVISHPRAGWESLKDRLIRDLSAEGLILPIQARVVFDGLIKFEWPSYLNIRAYEREGGIKGLEAATIESAVSAAASAADISESRVLDALLQLVDETNPELPKSRTASQEELLGAARIDRDTDFSRGSRMLGTLTQKGVIQPCMDEALEDTERRWSLYHDYLARAVLSAHRRADRWQRLLKEKRQAFQDAANWRARWRALLSPWEQLKLIWPTLRGRVRWGEGKYGGFALWSITLRFFFPLLVILGLGVVGVDRGLDWQARMEAERILAAIRAGVGSSRQASVSLPKDEEYRQLRILAAARPRLKRAFVELSLTDTASQSEVLYHVEAIYQSLVGLDPDYELHTAFHELALRDKPLTPYSAALAALTHQTLPQTEPQQTVRIANALLEAIEENSASALVFVFESFLRTLGDQLPAKQTGIIAQRLVAMVRDASEEYEIEEHVSLLLSLGERLPPEQAEATARHLVGVMRAPSNEAFFKMFPHMFTRSLANLAGQLPPEYTKAAAQRLVEVISTTTDVNELYGLTLALGRLGEKLPMEQAEVAARRLVEVMGDTKYVWSLNHLGSALRDLGKRLPRERALSVGNYLLSVGTKGEATKRKPFSASIFLSTSAGLGMHLGTELAEAVAQTLVAVMGEITDADNLEKIVLTLVGLGEQLPQEYVEAAAQRLIAVMNPKVAEADLGKIISALNYLDERLPVELADAALLRLVEVIHESGRVWYPSAFASPLRELSGRLSARAAEAAAQRLMEMIANADRWQHDRLGLLVLSLSERLPTKQTEEIVRRLLEKGGITANQDKFTLFAEALAKLPLPPNPDAMDSAIDLLQSPVAYDHRHFKKTRTDLLRYYSRLAGLEEEQWFKTTDDFIAWVRIHRPDLDLMRPPRNPFLPDDSPPTVMP
uniref:Novel STAND NTPase 1 domain-containing protein n=1 Tax=Candidatus Kentrum sp. LPFa TaxID=2126335 RepID=A0A450W480_9GAMM|nr:MAG: hypothetical protein BECKLPF1236B_GA0070989_102522 [Candidatus Kentron sp. LPFa]